MAGTPTPYRLALQRPGRRDEQHAFGHSKAEYFSRVVEGVLILVAAGSIAMVFTHLEALVIQRFWEDTGLDRAEAPATRYGA